MLCEARLASSSSTGGEFAYSQSALSAPRGSSGMPYSCNGDKLLADSPVLAPPLFVSLSSFLSSLPSSHISASVSTFSSTAVNNDTDSSASILSGLTFGARHTSLDGQADLARLTNTMKSLVESNERCWRGEDCELCTGVRQGLVHVSSHTQRHADALEHRVSRILTYAIRRSVLTHSASRGQCFTPLWSPSRSS